MDNPIKTNKEFIFNLIQKGKDAGMIWNGVAWVPAGADGKPSKVSKGPKITEVSRVSKKTNVDTDSTGYASKNFIKSFTKVFGTIAQEIGSIKKSLLLFVKNQEKIKKKADEEKLREKNEAYLAKYKKTSPQRAEPEKEQRPRGSLFSFLIELFKGILKFFAVGIGLIVLSKFLKQPGVQDAIKNLIVKIIATISDLIAKGAELIHEILKPGETSNKIIGFIEKIIFSVMQVISDFIGFIKNLVQKIASDDKLLSNVQSIIENIIITFFTFIKTTVESLKSVFQEVGPEITEAIISGITFILDGIASGIQFLTSLVNNPEFAQGFADVFRAMYDLIASIFNIEVPIPYLGTVKLGTIVLIVTATMGALDLAMKGIIAYLVIRTAKAGIRAGVQAATSVSGAIRAGKGSSATKTECSDVLGGVGTPGSTNKRRKVLDYLGTGLQVGGLAIGATAAAYSYAEMSGRGDELRQQYGTIPNDENASTASTAPSGNFTPRYTTSPESTSSPTPTSGSVPSSTPTTTRTSPAVPAPAAMTTTTTSATSTTPTRPVDQNPPGMPRTLLEYVGMEFERKKAREGFRNKAYASPEGGTDTIGIGHKKSKREQDEGGVFIGGQFIKADRNTPLTDQQVKDLYIQDIMKHAEGAKNRINSLAGQDVWSGLNPMQQYALMDLSYAGGPKLITKDLADAISSGDMNKAAQIIQQKARTYRKNGTTIESAHHARHADLRADIFRGYDPLLTGGTGTPTALASSVPNEQRPSKPIPQSPGVNVAGIGQSGAEKNPFAFLEKLLPTEPNSTGGTTGIMQSYLSKSLETSPSMSKGGGQNTAEFLNSSSQELKKMLADSETFGALFKDQATNAIDKASQVALANKTSATVNPEVNSGIGSVYDEEFTKKIFA